MYSLYTECRSPSLSLSLSEIHEKEYQSFERRLSLETSRLVLNSSSSVNPTVVSNVPVATHQRFIIFNGCGEQIKIIKINTPCSAINISKNANGDITVASATTAVK